MEDDTIHDEIGCLLKRRRGERGLQYCAFTGLAKANAASNASVVVCCMFERTESGVKREVEKGGDGRFEVVSQRRVAKSFPISSFPCRVILPRYSIVRSSVPTYPQPLQKASKFEKDLVQFLVFGSFAVRMQLQWGSSNASMWSLRR